MVSGVAEWEGAVERERHGLERQRRDWNKGAAQLEQGSGAVAEQCRGAGSGTVVEHAEEQSDDGGSGAASREWHGG